MSSILFLMGVSILSVVLWIQLSKIVEKLGILVTFFETDEGNTDDTGMEITYNVINDGWKDENTATQGTYYLENKSLPECFKYPIATKTDIENGTIELLTKDKNSYCTMSIEDFVGSFRHLPTEIKNRLVEEEESEDICPDCEKS